jgi:hypothetical protein
MAMKSLLDFKEGSCPKDHICFIGAGRDEDDQYLMVKMKKCVFSSDLYEF